MHSADLLLFGLPPELAADFGKTAESLDSPERLLKRAPFFEVIILGPKAAQLENLRENLTQIAPDAALFTFAAPLEGVPDLAFIPRAQAARALERALKERHRGTFSDILESRLPGRSPQMRDLRTTLTRIAKSSADLLITGPSGAGKEAVARALHEASVGAERPFIAINCAALPETLIESELFGHEAGAFAGALRTRFGKFEHARGGTVLLDELAQMPRPLQAKFSRVLQERSITRLGSNEVIPLDVRFIATAKDASSPCFHEDLYWRLTRVTLNVPPLSERREDIPELFVAFLQRAAADHNRKFPALPSGFLTELASREWPGNLRELHNCAERLVLCLAPFGSDAPTGARSLAEHMADYERSLLAASIAAHGGQLKPVYKALKISRKTLYDKMQRYGLQKQQFTGSEQKDVQSLTPFGAANG